MNNHEHAYKIQSDGMSEQTWRPTGEGIPMLAPKQTKFTHRIPYMDVMSDKYYIALKRRLTAMNYGSQAL
jgi:hypothetical protein